MSNSVLLCVEEVFPGKLVTLDAFSHHNMIDSLQRVVRNRAHTQYEIFS